MNGVDSNNSSRSSRPGSWQDVSAEVVGRWYLRLAKECHPDAGGTHEEMKEVNRAREVLIEETER